MSEFLACIRPDQVTEGDYLAFLNQDARPEFERHLAECEFCQRELQVYRNLDNKVRRQFEFISSPARTLCPETQHVGEYIAGLLSGLEADKLRRHLATCEWCTAELTEMRRWLQAPDPLLEELPARPPDQPQSDRFEWLRRVVASLLKPHTLSYAEAGVRGTTEGLPLTFQAEELTIVLTVQAVGPRSQVLNILGLVQTDDGNLDALIGRKICLSSQGREVASEALDELGNFIFENVQPPQPFDLEIMLETRIIIVPDLQMN
jgi:anti-sigma factor RsiW